MFGKGSKMGRKKRIESREATELGKWRNARSSKMRTATNVQGLKLKRSGEAEEVRQFE